MRKVWRQLLGRYLFRFAVMGLAGLIFDTQLTVFERLKTCATESNCSCVFSRQTPSLREQNMTSLFDFALAKGSVWCCPARYPVPSRCPDSQQLLYPAAAFLQNFCLTGESTHPPRSAPQHPYLLRPVPPAEKRRFGKIITLPALSLIAFAIETEDVSPQTITFPDVLTHRSTWHIHADRHLLRSKGTLV